MTWKKPRFPATLNPNMVRSSFSRLRKRDLGVKIGDILQELFATYSAVPWKQLEMRDLYLLKKIDNFTKEKLQEKFDEARAVVNGDYAAIAEQCITVRDELQTIKDEEMDDTKGLEDAFTKILDQLELLAQEADTALLETHFDELFAAHMADMDKFAEKELARLKKNIPEMVNKVKKVIELEFEADYETVDPLLSFCYKGIQMFIRDYLKVVEKGLGGVDSETVRNELEPIIKFDTDESLLNDKAENDEVGLEGREISVIVGDETDEEAIKKHCIRILEAVKALPIKYKE